MKFVILAGGLGTRLRPFTFNIPKPLLPLGKTTLLDHIISRLKDYNPSEIILSLGYHSQLIRAYCEQKNRFGLNLNFIEEDKPLGTAGSLLLIKDRLASEECFFLMNGDIITTLNFNTLLDFHKSKRSSLTVAIVQHEYQSPFGVLEIKDGKVFSITEKPTITQAVSAGIYCINSSIIDYIPSNNFFTMPDLMNSLIKNNKSVFTYEIKEYWRALETVENFNDVISDLVIE